MAIGTFKWQQNKKKVSKKVLFPLMARPLPPTPLLMARPLVEELLFAASLNKLFFFKVQKNIFVILLFNPKYFKLSRKLRNPSETNQIFRLCLLFSYFFN